MQMRHGRMRRRTPAVRFCTGDLVTGPISQGSVAPVEQIFRRVAVVKPLKEGLAAFCPSFENR